MRNLKGRHRATNPYDGTKPKLDGATTVGFPDTVHLSTDIGGTDDERIVRPCLAILFRVAVGRAADYYVPRFLEYERIGRSFPSWNWASPWVPPIWAFHHKLWGAGVAFSVWSVAAMAAFDFIDPHLDDSILVSLACAAVLLWLLPAIVAALSANSLLFHKARRIVRQAEAVTSEPLEAVQLLGKRSSVLPAAAVLLGGIALMIAFVAAAPKLQTAVADRVVRTHVAEALAALQPLQRRVENSFGIVESPPIALDDEFVERQRGATFLEAVSVNRESGRVRAYFGELIPELAGRWVLLAPLLDRDHRVRWMCIPVDVPARYLPQACRRG